MASKNLYGKSCLAADKSKYVELFEENLKEIHLNFYLTYIYICTFVKTGAKEPEGELDSVMAHFQDMKI